MLEIRDGGCDWIATAAGKAREMRDLCSDAFRERLTPHPEWGARAAEIDAHLLAGEAVVLRGLGRDPHILPVVALAMDGKLHDPEGFAIISTLQVRAFTASASESTAVIAFHTDFASDPQPPDVVALQVDTPDPRHPHFGRNQVASVARVLDQLDEITPKARLQLTRMQMPVGDFGRAFVGPALPDLELPVLLWPAPVLNRARLDDTHLVDGLSILDLIEEAAKAVCEDVALDAGDILLADNRRALHRRGECSVPLTSGNREGRKIHTLRWFR